MKSLNTEKSTSGLAQVRSVRSVSILRRWVLHWQDSSFWWWFRPIWKRNPKEENGGWSR